jgi:hypothetical protein
MNAQTIFNRVYRIAGLLLAFLFLSVIAGAQELDALTGRSEMTSLKKLVLGIDDTVSNCHLERKTLENIDFEMYVEREILIERWMHDRDFWIHRTKETNGAPQHNETLHRDGAWELLDSDLGVLLKPEAEPEIKLASWMYADEFIQHVTSGPSNRLEQWMMDRSYWAMKK